MPECDPQLHSLLMFGRHRGRLIARVAVILEHRQIEIVGLATITDTGRDIAAVCLSLRLPVGRPLDAEIKRLNRCVDIVKIVPLSDLGGLTTLALVRVRAAHRSRLAEITRAGRRLGAEVVLVADAEVTFQITGLPSDVSRICEGICRLGECDVVQTGPIALPARPRGVPRQWLAPSPAVA